MILMPIHGLLSTFWATRA